MSPDILWHRFFFNALRWLKNWRISGSRKSTNVFENISSLLYQMLMFVASGDDTYHLHSTLQKPSGWNFEKWVKIWILLKTILFSPVTLLHVSSSKSIKFYLIFKRRNYQYTLLKLLFSSLFVIGTTFRSSTLWPSSVVYYFGYMGYLLCWLLLFLSL